MDNPAKYALPFSGKAQEPEKVMKQSTAVAAMLASGEYFDAHKLAKLLGIKSQAANRFLYNISRSSRYETQLDPTHSILRFKLLAVNKICKAFGKKPTKDAVNRKVAAVNLFLLAVHDATAEGKIAKRKRKTAKPEVEVPHITVAQLGTHPLGTKPIEVAKAVPDLSNVMPDKVPLWQTAAYMTSKEAQESVRRAKQMNLFTLATAKS
jgi:hypothetical protein